MVGGGDGGGGGRGEEGEEVIGWFEAGTRNWAAR